MHSAICAPSTSCHSSTLWHESDLRIAEGSCIDDISEQHDEREPDERFCASSSAQATNPLDEINQKLRDELAEQEARAGNGRIGIRCLFPNKIRQEKTYCLNF